MFLLACTTLLATGNIQKTNLVKLRKKVYTKYTHISKNHSFFPPNLLSSFHSLKKKKYLFLGLLDKNNYTNFKFQWENTLWQMLAKFLNIAFSGTVISEKLNLCMFWKYFAIYWNAHWIFFSIYKVYTKKHISLHAHVVKNNVL